MTNEMKIKLQENLADPEFCSGMCDCMKAEEAFAYFAQNGLEMEEMEVLETWNAAMQEDTNRIGKLTDKELEKVAGGFKVVCVNKLAYADYCLEWGIEN